MENKQELQAQDLQELVARLEKQAARQTGFARWQCIMAAVCCVVFLVMAGILASKAMDISLRVETVVSHLESITAELDEADLKGMVENLDSLAVTSQASIQEAMGEFSSIDFEALNRAIANLAGVVEPLSRFFGIFN